jgi:hypothetical protein
LAHPDEPQRALNAALRGSALTNHPVREAIVALVVALAICALGYMALVVPGSWFPNASQRSWLPREMKLVSGAGQLVKDELVVAREGAEGGVLVSVDCDFRSTDYPAIFWSALNVPDQADARLVWRTDYAPSKINSVPLRIGAGQPLIAYVSKDPNWVGRIRGLALAINGTLPQPVVIRGVTATPLGALDVTRDRIDEWLAYEGFKGTSINSVTGGADRQDVPLPLLLALVMLLAAAAWYALAKVRGSAIGLPVALATVFIAGWLLLDARWMWDLVREARVTAGKYAGLDSRGKHLAAEDGPLFAFIENVRKKLPAEPVRVFMTADAHYYRGRGAYHLYPHNVFFDPFQNAVPASSRLRPGDYFVVYQRRGIEYDAAARKLRWDGGAPVSADLLLSGPGAALFRIRQP